MSTRALELAQRKAINRTPKPIALAPDTIPADAHFTAASQLIHLAGSLQGEHQRLTIESVQHEVALGLRAIAERRFTMYPMTARELESMRAP
jgi:hypothetical protein